MGRWEKGVSGIEWLDRSMFTQAAQFSAKETGTRVDGSATLSVAVAMVNIAVVSGWVLGGGEEKIGNWNMSRFCGRAV